MNKEQKLAIVSRHFVTGATVLTADLTSYLTPVQTFGGENLTLIRDAYRVFISYENDLFPVLNEDVMASNGVIHVIDEVILPPWKQGNVVDVARAAGNFKTLLKILSELEVPPLATGLKPMTLIDILKSQRKVTVFAPSDEAFAKVAGHLNPGLFNPKLQPKIFQPKTFQP